MKKREFLFAALILGIALFLFLLWTLRFGGSGEWVRVTLRGEVYGEYPLKEDREVSIEGRNYLRIRGGEADMVSADCPDQICVHSRPISKQGESLICLPNQVVVTILSGERSAYDSVT